MKTYMLKDGSEVLSVRTMSDEEFGEAAAKALAHTDGNLGWVEANGWEIVKGMKHVQLRVALAAIINGTSIGEAIEIAKTY